MNSLVEHWSRARLEGPRYLHPDDEGLLKRESSVHSYASFVEEFETGVLKPKAFHFSLMPVPYLGDLDNAEVLILLLNPGLHASDYLLEEEFDEFRDELRCVIRQESRTNPFLDPRWAWTSGFTWWQRKLGRVAQLVAQERYNGHYGKALQCLARRLAVIELVPYHSLSFGGPSNMPSTRAALAFVADVAEAGDRTVIVTRRAREWNLSPSGNVIVYSGSQARGASLGPDTAGGMAILKLYGIPTSLRSSGK